MYIAELIALNEITTIIRPPQTNYPCNAAVCMQVPVFALIAVDFKLISQWEIYCE